ncbi:AAA ATPase containing von Willebrand factor type A domain [Candidatus Rickettsiella viridis]|uniref:AAA ATPase containing von Willebrand factor type A domain n=1 Tax=Candidatus Rickettsiella viridis TaxID=676208 RepID=A0A2Z5UWW9_9COXI|nr:AAA family ATPase [Candidatus Rickettsiella viridis]BBB15460.1 AAA ATPase containing von Willebrand factor type A domain [Candidatus Rickettsiella viridis]
MLKFPDEFYHRSLIAGQEYTEIPSSGRIDPQRFIEGKSDCFVKNAYQNSDKAKKHLVLTDWIYPFLSNIYGNRTLNEFRDKYKNYIESLVDAGFKVWVFVLDTEHHASLSCINDNDYSIKQSIRHANEVVPPISTIMELMAEQGVARSQVCILDFYAMKEHIGAQTFALNSLEVDFRTFSLPLVQFFEFLGQNSTITKLYLKNINQYALDLDDLLVKISKRLPQLNTLKIDFRYSTGKIVDCSEIFRNVTFPSLRRFLVAGPISIDETVLNKFLNSCPQCESLLFNFEYNSYFKMRTFKLDPNKLLKGLTFSELRKLTIYGALELDTAVRENFLSHCPLLTLENIDLGIRNYAQKNTSQTHSSEINPISDGLISDRYSSLNPLFSMGKNSGTIKFDSDAELLAQARKDEAIAGSSSGERKLDVETTLNDTGLTEQTREDEAIAGPSSGAPELDIDTMLSDLRTILSDAWLTAQTKDDEAIAGPSSGANKLDVDTAFSDAELTAQTYFGKNIAVSSYRLFVSDTIVKNKNGYLALEAIKTSPERLNQQPAKVHDLAPFANDKDNTCITGQMVARLNSSDWTPLPSLSADEELLAYRAQSELEFARASNSDQYFMRLSANNSSKEESVKIEYKLRIPKTSISSNDKFKLSRKQKGLLKSINQLCFNADGSLQDNSAYQQLIQQDKTVLISLLINALKKFGIDKEKKITPQDDPCMHDYTGFNRLLEKKVGACRHRAYLFLALAKAFNIKARVITNAAHAFIEVAHEEKWIKCDLGGYPTKVNKKPLQMLPENEIKQSEQEKALSKPLIVDKFTEDLNLFYTKLETYKPNKQQAMLVFPHQESIELFYEGLHVNKRVPGQKILYLPSFRDLTTQTVQVTKTGINIMDSDFIRKLKQLQPGDILLINYDRFQMTDVGFNSLYDDFRQLRNIAIPEGVLILAAMDKDTSQQMGEDVVSRFSIRQEWKTTPTQQSIALAPEQNDTLEENNDSTSSPLVIDLYDNVFDWKERLIGRLSPSGKTNPPFIYKTGIFQQAWKEGRNVQIIHAPLDNTECQRFFADLVRNRYIDINGESVTLPEKFSWELTNPKYCFEQPLQIIANPQSNDYDYVLSPFTIEGLLQQYSYCNKTHIFTEKPGLLEKYAGQSMRLYVTQELSVGTWASLCAAAQKHNCQLKLILADNVKLPEEMKTEILPTTFSTLTDSTSKNILHPPYTCHFSSDANFTAKKIQKENKHLQIISIDAQTSYQELVCSLQQESDTGVKDASMLLPLMRTKEGALLKAIEEGRSILIKGQFSPELASNLSSLFAAQPFLMVNGEQRLVSTSQVMLVTEQPNAFAYLNKTNLYQAHSVTAQERLALLQEENKPLEESVEKIKQRFADQTEILETFSFAQLKTMAERLKEKPETDNPLKTLAMFSKDFNTSRTKTEIKKSKQNPELTTTEAAAYEETKRLEKIKSALANAPYTFLMGPSGIGKSTLVFEKLKDAYKREEDQTLELTVGMDEIGRWAKEPAANSIHILFIDEANLSKEGTFDIFEGLFDDPPSILIKGEICTLTPQHKVIFCGNFLDFEGRQTHRFFQQHGHGLVLKDWSDTFLKNILNQLLDQVHQAYSLELLSKEKEQIITLFLKTYRDLPKDTQNKQFLTLRNLQMMVLRFANHGQNYPELTSMQRAFLSLYDEVKPYLPKALRAEWKSKFKQNEKSYRELRPGHKEEGLTLLGNNYVVPASRQRTLELLEYQLAIREKQKEQPSIHKLGLKGILLEGASGVGKSALVMALLEKHGYQKTATEPAKRYYYLTLTDMAEVKDTLTKAFHEGAIVLIDELNTAPIENLLNALMSGVDLEGKEAEKPGFLVIGTQNPINFANRSPLSKALQNRFHKVEVKPYRTEELQAILICKGMDGNAAKDRVQAYEENNKKTSNAALKETPRDLMKETGPIQTDRLESANKWIIEERRIAEEQQQQIIEEQRIAKEQQQRIIEERRIAEEQQQQIIEEQRIAEKQQIVAARLAQDSVTNSFNDLSTRINRYRLILDKKNDSLSKQKAKILGDLYKALKNLDETNLEKLTEFKEKIQNPNLISILKEYRNNTLKKVFWCVFAPFRPKTTSACLIAELEKKTEAKINLAMSNTHRSSL